MLQAAAEPDVVALADALEDPLSDPCCKAPRGETRAVEIVFIYICICIFSMFIIMYAMNIRRPFVHIGHVCMCIYIYICFLCYAMLCYC